MRYNPYFHKMNTRVVFENRLLWYFEFLPDTRRHEPPET
jgi:hypothetical protein